jgi:hypothetical protein
VGFYIKKFERIKIFMLMKMTTIKITEKNLKIGETARKLILIGAYSILLIIK